MVFKLKVRGQFSVFRLFVSLCPDGALCAHRLDGKHVVFGSVVDGLDVVRKMEGYGSSSGKPKGKVVIANCGQL